MTIRILGLGNVLMGDDGFGPAVIHRLRAGWEFPEGVEVEDLGTPGLDLVPYLGGADLVVLLDTVKADGPPGERRRYDKAEILRHAPAARVGPHDPGVKACLLALEFDGRAPAEVLLLGAIPASVAMSTSLSAPLADAVGPVAEAVVAELHRRGLEPRRREAPLAGKPWWERP